MSDTRSRTLTGKVPRERIVMLELPRLEASVLDGYRALVDLTGTVSDAMDALGIVGTVPAFVLQPMLAGKRAVGQALTVRNVEKKQQIFRAASEKVNLMGESEAHNLAEAGDIVVIEGLLGCSNLGGQSATIGHRQGEAAVIVDGSIRDPDASRELGFPVWCRGVTPITGKWRLETVEINGPVSVCGVQVRAGDLVCADDAGVCFVPREHAAAILDEARRIDAGDTLRKGEIERGVDVSTLMTRKYK
ncbi:MAG: RraA family protein [Proteobacteria bacterium]|nr:RraA family protein [Burkholderiales bacterium]